MKVWITKAITPDVLRKPPPSAQNLPNSRGGYLSSRDLDQFFFAIFGSFYLAVDTPNRKIFARLRRDFLPKTYRYCKIFARLRRDFTAKTYRYRKFFACAYGAIVNHKILWQFCAAGKKILGVLTPNHGYSPFESEQNWY